MPGQTRGFSGASNSLKSRSDLGCSIGPGNLLPTKPPMRQTLEKMGRLGFIRVRLGPQTGPKSTPNDPDRTSDNLKLQPQKL